MSLLSALKSPLVASSEKICQFVAELKCEEERVDLGHSFVIRGEHPSMGRIVIVNSASGDSLVMPV